MPLLVCYVSIKTFFAHLSSGFPSACPSHRNFPFLISEITSGRYGSSHTHFLLPGQTFFPIFSREGTAGVFVKGRLEGPQTRYRRCGQEKHLLAIEPLVVDPIVQSLTQPANNHTGATSPSVTAPSKRCTTYPSMIFLTSDSSGTKVC